MANNKKFWDKIAPRYARSAIGDMDVYEHKLKLTRAHFSPDSRVLELGCGTGSTAILHAPYVGHIQATDLSDEMLKIARDKAKGIGNISFQQSSVDAIEAPSEGFDVVMAMSLLHLLEDRDNAIVRVFSLLKPGGVFVSSTICMSEALWFLRPVLPVGRWLGFVPMVRFFTRNQLEQSLVKAGFEIETSLHPARNKAVFFAARKPAD